MKFRNANIDEVGAILSLYRRCNAHLFSLGIEQWTDDYPSNEIVESDVLLNSLYVLTKDEEIIGCITLNEQQDKAYQDLKWLTSDTSKNLVVHRLAVVPKYQRKGYAKLIMKFAEKLALQNNFVSIRLDTYSKNKMNQQFYEKLDYKKVGEVYLTHKNNFPYCCFEKLLN